MDDDNIKMNTEKVVGEGGDDPFSGSMDFGDPSSDRDDGTDVLIDDRNQRNNDRSSGGAQPPMWSLDYYKQFFNVDTEQVNALLFLPLTRVSRLKSSVWPVDNVFLKQIKGRGDLWGPFWISTTLVFVIAVAGNINSWQNTSEVTLAATMIYAYITCIPLVLYATFGYYRVGRAPSLLEIVCLYGYTLSVFVPIAILCLVVGNMFRWILIITGFCLTCSVIVINIREVLHGQRENIEFGVLYSNPNSTFSNAEAI
eukprot:UC4_evm1s178